MSAGTAQKPIELQVRPGSKVITVDNEEIGEVLRIVERGGGFYLQVVKYGPGRDELYIPAASVHRVVERHVYVDLDSVDLLGKAWHELP